MSVEVALDLARSFQVAVVDRFGETQVTLRDRFARPHTVPTATGKAWIAVTFHTNTGELVAMTQPRHAAGGRAVACRCGRPRRRAHDRGGAG